MLKIVNLYKDFDDGTKCLKNINLEFGNCGLVYIKGKSGSGKTTLLNLLSSISKPTSGKIYYNDVDINSDKGYLRNNVTYIIQEHNLISFLNVKENFKLNSVNLKLEKCSEVLTNLGINKIIKKDIYQISGGEAKRVEIASSLFNNSKILLCDEPLNNLDSENMKIIMDLLKKISKSKLVILTGHAVDFITSYADMIITLENGKIVKNDVVSKKDECRKTNKKKNTLNSFIFLNGLFRDKLKKNCLYLVLLFTLNIISIFSLNSLISDIEIDTHALIDNKINRTFIFTDFDNISLKKKAGRYKIKRDFTQARTYYKNNHSLKLDTEIVLNENLYYKEFNNNLKFAVINDNTFLKEDIIVGRIPEKPNEILVSEYFLNCFLDIVNHGQDINDMIGKSVGINGLDFIIVGYLKQNIQEYEFLKKLSKLSNDTQNNLYNLFNSGISSKDVIYVSNYFDTYIEYDYYETSFYIYASNDYYDLLHVKKEFNTSDFYVEDFYSDFIRNYNNIISILRRLSMIVLVVVTVVIIFIYIDYINYLTITYIKDFYTLLYYGYNNINVSKIIFGFISLIHYISFIISMVVSIYITNHLNLLLKNVINLNINVFHFDIYNIFYYICIESIFLLILSFIYGRKIIKKFAKQFS